MPAITRAIAVWTDDGWWWTGGPSFSADTSLYFPIVSGNTGAFFRHTDIQVPNSRLITAAFIRFTAWENYAGGASVTIRGNDVDNAVAPTNVTTAEALVPTSASRVWAVPTFVAGATFDTPDLSPIVQEIVNRPLFVPGYAMQFTFKNSSGSRRRIYGFDLNASNPGKYATLYITYAVGGMKGLGAGAMAEVMGL